ncbi:Disks large-associated protein 2 [Bagarius yarrelli]|uniref:Disks large-associated protein 2 n=1 Tax=Bagarius yarrelli TaxID=175774 RepID=A0A556TT07_BAGYA|nr:Disks large-associated protein 2 [Bagarius yarrelli]
MGSGFLCTGRQRLVRTCQSYNTEGGYGTLLRTQYPPFTPLSPFQHFNEDRNLPRPGNMKGLSGSRGQHHQLPLPHSPCGLVEFDRPHDIHGIHSSDIRHTYLLSPTESCAMDYQHHQRYSPRSSIHSDCMMLSPTVLQPTGTADHITSSTFPRMHYGSQYHDSRDDCATITTSATSAAAASFASYHGVSKSNRIPANLLDPFEKQLPTHRDGFHTLQYQRASATEQRSESPGRIRHLVHSVQKLFTKSHSLEGSSKMNGAKGEGGAHHHHSAHHSSKHGVKRSKSKERKHRSGSWWSSDDNLDSDGNYRPPGGMSRHPAGHCVSESVRPHFGDHSLKTSKSSNDVKCSACETISMPPEGKFMKRSSWSTLTVSQAKEAYRKSSLNLDKPSLRASHYLQVPHDEWSAYPGTEKDEEIPCRRMRSSSYVKAMGDDESGDSDTSPKTSPPKSVRPDALVLKSTIHRPQSQGYHLQTTRDLRPHPGVSLDPATSYNPPQYRSRNQSYMRAVSTLSQASCLSQVSETEVNGQYESVCESVFSEVESQAMEALDLPGAFRTRSHSYLRAIQAGYSQDDDCLPSMTSSTVTSTLRSTTEGYDAMEGTSLLNEDMIEDDDGASSSAYQELERFERENAARSHHSTSSTVTAISVAPTSSPPIYRVPAPTPSIPEPHVPQAIQAFKESANMVAAFNMQWKEEIAAMRFELAELRRDVCNELKTFNSNFFNFTQCYNMWTLCREAATGSSTQSSDRVSVGIQTGNNNGPVRQNTVDVSVMCQPEPAPFNIFEVMNPPRIEITEGTPEGPTTSNSPTSPASPVSPTDLSGQRPLGETKMDTSRRKKSRSRPEGQRSSSLELWCRKYTRIQFRLPTACNVERTQEPTPEPAVTFTPSYKKTPPPVPPRSVTKPIISVTAQSSTESMQDAYHEGRLPRLPRSRDVWGKYVSTESLDSAKALTLATEGRRLVSTGSYTSVQTCDKAILVSKAEEYLKTPRSSVGIQVEAVTDSEAETKGFPQYHSVGIQVEGEKRHGRFKRSNSVTAAVQADVEHELFRAVEDKVVQFGGFQRHSEPSSPAQYSATRTVRTQGIFTYRDDYRSPSGPPSPRSAAWVEEPEETETGQVSPVRADGSWYMQLLHNETKRMEAWCKIRSAVGSAQLLMSQKFQQFYWLCEQNLDPSAMPRPTAQDLAGFWDLLQLSVDDVTAKFDELQKMKRNEWRNVEEPEEKERKWPPPTVKRPPKGRGPGLTRERSLDLQDRQRQEARRRLMAAKRAASFRQSSVSERADSIEIYIPEAQTRL